VPIVSVPPPYQGPTHGESEIPVDGASVRECLAAVEQKYPGFLAQVFDAQGQLHRFVKLFRNEDPIAQSELDEPLGSGDMVSIVAAIGGG
jgi:molybdopterin converting factor small subunit